MTRKFSKSEFDLWTRSISATLGANPSIGDETAIHVADRVVDIVRRLQPKTSKPLQRKPTMSERYWTTIETAKMLGMTVGAVRARAQRVARREAGKIVAHIGPGVIGYKFGRTWRFKIVGVVTPDLTPDLREVRSH